MQVSLKWLNELVDLSGIEPAQIAHELTMSGLEVEEIEEIKAKFTNIITARIEKIDNHTIHNNYETLIQKIYELVLQKKLKQP